MKCITIAAFILVAHTAANAQPITKIPKDFRIAAHYVVGDIIMMQGEVLDVSVSADGSVVRKSVRLEDKKEKAKITRKRLSQAEIRQLIDVIDKLRFYDLPAKYRFIATDCPPLVLTVTSDVRSHRVLFPPCMREEKSAERFERIWHRVICTLTPKDCKRS